MGRRVQEVVGEVPHVRQRLFLDARAGTDGAGIVVRLVGGRVVEHVHHEPLRVRVERRIDPLVLPDDPGRVIRKELQRLLGRRRALVGRLGGAGDEQAERRAGERKYGLHHGVVSPFRKRLFGFTPSINKSFLWPA